MARLSRADLAGSVDRKEKDLVDIVVSRVNHSRLTYIGQRVLRQIFVVPQKLDLVGIKAAQKSRLPASPPQSWLVDSSRPQDETSNGLKSSGFRVARTARLSACSGDPYGLHTDSG